MNEEKKVKLRVLIIEDSEDDAFFLVRHLQQGGYDPDYKVVDTPDAFVHALSNLNWDIILCDYKMPRFNAISALNLVKERDLDLPFIIISGTIGEETAVKAMRLGAHDYIMKDNLTRLSAAIDRELREAEMREKHINAVGELSRSEERYRHLVESLPLAIIVLAGDNIIYGNPVADKLFITSTPGELIRRSAFDLIDPNYWDMARKVIQGTIYGEGVPEVELKFIRLNGEEFFAEVSSTKVLFKGIAVYMVIIRDITDQKNAQQERDKFESQFHLAQKMESLGIVAGGIAHNFNNALMVIQGSVSLMIKGKCFSHPDFEYLRGIEQAVANATELTRDLLSFAMGGKYNVKPTDLNELIKHENKMFSRTKKEIRIHEKYDKCPCIVEVDQGQIQQSFLNLYINAWQAMQEGGNIYVETRNITISESDAHLFEIMPGRFIEITVTDTGVGMDEEVCQRIFEPFYTTKGIGHGTGLGLSSVYGIIKNHGGCINVFSEKGNGTTFKIYLPTVEKHVEREKEVFADVLKGSETILLVDDERMITDVATDLMKFLGYRVFIANNGENAIDVYRKNIGDIDMVILDMIMPGMSGGDVYRVIKDMNPEVRVLLSSGYSLSSQAKKILDQGCNGFIQKPYKLKEFSQKLREVLGASDLSIKK